MWKKLPQELFEYILNNIGESQRSPWVIMDSVNKYWARISRERLFREITIRSSSDVHELLSFVQRTGSMLPSIIQGLRPTPRILPGICEHPWHHLLPLLFSRLPFCNTTDVRVELDFGKLPFTQRPRRIRFVHWKLPKRCPSFSTHIHSLSLVAI